MICIDVNKNKKNEVTIEISGKTEVILNEICAALAALEDSMVNGYCKEADKMKAGEIRAEVRKLLDGCYLIY